jgi:protein SCO1/2
MEAPRRRHRLVLFLVLAAALPVQADDPHAHCQEVAAHAAEAMAPAAPAPALDSSQVDVTLVDAPLVDQDGRSVRLAADVVGDHLVVVSFVYTSCTTVCPIISARLTRLQERLGDRLGREVRLVSLSIDPRRDTPARLKAYAARHRAGPYWLHLTGRPEAVEQVLRGLGAYTASFAEHAPLTLVGDGRTGRWTRLNGFASADQVIAQLDGLAAARRLVSAERAAP